MVLGEEVGSDVLLELEDVHDAGRRGEAIGV